MLQRDGQVVILHPHHQIIVRRVVPSKPAPPPLEMGALLQVRQIRGDEAMPLDHRRLHPRRRDFESGRHEAVGPWRKAFEIPDETVFCLSVRIRLPL